MLRSISTSLPVRNMRVLAGVRLPRRKTRELGFPVAQYIGFHPNKLAYLANFEIQLVRNRRCLVSHPFIAILS